jgi:hypothetical protein
MENETTSTTLTNQIMTELIQSYVAEAIREASVMLPLVDVVDIGNVPTKTASWQFAAGATAAAIVEGTAVANSAWTLTEATATAAQVGVKVELMDLGRRSTVTDIASAVAMDLASACMEKFDTDAAALLGGFSNTVGTSTQDITIANLIAAITKLRIQAKGLANQSAFVLYPQQVADIQTAILSASNGLAPALSREGLAAIMGDTVNSAVLGAQVGSFMGIPVFQSVLVPTANVGEDSAGALFAVKRAIGAAMKWMPEIEMQRGVSNGQNSDNLLATMAYGVVELRDALGVSIITDR